MVEAFRPLTLDEALALRSSRETTIHAGGSDLMVRHKTWSGVVPQLPNPALMIGHLKELRVIRVVDDTVQIGACCTLAQILSHGSVPDHVKLPLKQMASPSIRNIATMGGNIANASPAGDSLPMLYTLDARLTLQSQTRTTEVNIADFITGPGTTILEDDQIVTRISIPLTGFRRVYWKKVGTRRANSVSKLSLYAVAGVVDNRVEVVRMSFGSVAATVVRSREAETLLTMAPTARIHERLTEVKACYAPLITPINDLRSTKAYRKGVAFGLLEDCLLGLR